MGLKEFQAVVKQIRAENPTFTYKQAMAEAKKQSGTVKQPTTPTTTPPTPPINLIVPLKK